MTKFLLAAALLLIGLAPAVAADQSKPLNFSYTAIDGSHVDIADYRGKVVLIFFWATWSKESRDDVKIIVNARKKFRERGFEVLGVSLDSDQKTVINYTNEYAMNWPEYFDGRGDQNQVARTMGVKQVPSVWLIGKDGRTISINANGDLDAMIEKALKQPYAAK